MVLLDTDDLHKPIGKMISEIMFMDYEVCNERHDFMFEIIWSR